VLPEFVLVHPHSQAAVHRCLHSPLCMHLADLRTAVLVGGDAMEAQFAELALNPDIIVATPGGQDQRLEGRGSHDLGRQMMTGIGAFIPFSCREDLRSVL